jgi:thiamine biosynthesis protein ThiS
MLEELKVNDPLYVTVQLNGKLVPRADFDTALVRQGAVVEFLYYMGGGAAERTGCRHKTMKNRGKPMGMDPRPSNQGRPPC